MSEVNEIFGEEAANEKQSFSKEDWIIKKAEERTKAYDMLEEATTEVSSPDKLVQYLSVQSRFDRYSVSNALLVSHQMPEATRLGDSAFWKKQGAYIKKGEKGITILEPGEYTKQNGEKGVSYNAKKVFDIEQTDADKKPQRSMTTDIKKLVKALIKSASSEVYISNELPAGVNAQYNPEKNTIFIRQGLEGNEIFSCLAREIAVSRFSGNDIPNEDKAVSVFSVAFIVCKRNGIEPPVLPVKGELFSDKEPKEIRAVLSKARDEANTISAVMEKALDNRNRDAR